MKTTDQNDLDKKIQNSKEILRLKSKDYHKNFKNIENYIKNEVKIIETENKKGNSIIPQIYFKDLDTNSDDIINKIMNRGCVIIRNVFEEKKMNHWNTQLENYINENNYYDHQKEKAGIDQYFSDLKSGKPQIFGLYWSKTQVEIRQSIELDKVKKWLNKLWNYKNKDENIFDPNRELVYADRVRRREPGDSTLGLSPHCDAGSVERWIDEGYQKDLQ